MNVTFHRAGQADAIINITDASYVNCNLMGEETAFVEFFSTVPVGLRSGDWCQLLGHIYFILDAVIPVREVSRLKYELTLYGTQYELEKAKYFILDSTGLDQTTKTTWNCTPHEFLDQLIVNLKRIQPTVNWLAGDCLTADKKDVELNDNNCLELLKNAAELWEIYYFVDEFTVHLRKTPVSLTHEFEVGMNKGLREITANKSGDSRIITKLYAYGSNLNMPDGQPLTIAPIDDPDATEVIEGIKIFEDIYPRVECTVTGYYHMTENEMLIDPLTFWPDDYALSGRRPVISFQSGELQGLDFYFHMNSYSRIVLESYEIAGGITVPGSSGYNWVIGEKFVISNISMPPDYITAAETALLYAATTYFATASKQKVKLNVITDDLYFSRNNISILLGETVNIKSDIIPQLTGGISVSILGYKQLITQPHRYESLVVGDVYFKRPLGNMINILKMETVLKSTSAGGDNYYRHTQYTAASEWTVNHNLAKHPAVTVTDGSGKQIEAVVTYLSANQLKVNFSVAKAGFAECN